MKMSMTNGGMTFRATWFSPRLNRQRFKSFPIYIMKSVIGQLIFKFKMILLSICGHQENLSLSNLIFNNAFNIGFCNLNY